MRTVADLNRSIRQSANRSRVDVDLSAARRSLIRDIPAVAKFYERMGLVATDAPHNAGWIVYREIPSGQVASRLKDYLA